MESDRLYNIFTQCKGVTTDSRNCYPGSLFFALKGDRFDGNDFAIKALSEGCLFAVVDDQKLDGVPGCVLVPDALEALQNLARQQREVLPVKVIGITGSNGKTTTKELVALVLAGKYRVWHTSGNMNNHIGVPLTLLSIPLQAEIAVIEMGANHVGEIAMLSSLAQPDYGVVTNVGKAHIEGFGSFEGVKIAKGELYQFLEQNQAPAFINLDNPHLALMRRGGSYIGYGTSRGGLVIGRNASASPFLEFEWRIDKSTVWQRAVTRLTGLYNFENALAAVCVGVYFGIPELLINNALAGYEPVNNRSQLNSTACNKVVLDAYNANPDSMLAALSNFNFMAGETKVLILGGMKELGSVSTHEHEILVKQVLGMNLKRCFLVGPEFEGIVPDDERVSLFKTVETLVSYLNDNPLKNCLVLVKGSRSNRLETVLDVL